MGGPPSLHHGAAGLRGDDPTTPAETTPLPVASPGVDARLHDAWCTFLGKLATDAEAALAAALAYRQLDDAARDEWLSALRQDETRIRAPRLAVYAPLLAVESDERRRETILSAMGSDDIGAVLPPATAMRGRAADGTYVATIVRPLYLSFVGVLACGYRRSGGFLWVKHDPIVDGAHAPRPGIRLGGCSLEATPLKPLVDELAHVVVAHAREGREIPEALRVFADLFRPALDPADAPR